jgi:hypothetical protein
MDRAWLAGIEIGALPVFKLQPVSQRLKASDSGFILECTVDNATGYQWKKDGILLRDETSQNRTIRGATSPRLEVQGITAADSGGYTLEANNDFDRVSSRKADVLVPRPPVILNSMSQSGGAKVGDTLILSAQVGGALPITVTWWKDGKLFKRLIGSSLTIPNITTATSGTYSYSISNPYGIGGSGTVRVVVPSQN